jgi:hypothetical protein
MKKVTVWLMATMMVASLSGCGFTDGVKDGMNAAMATETSQEETKVQETASEATTEATETVTEETKQVETEPTETKQEETTTEAQEATQDQVASTNILLNAPVTVHDVKNGTKTEKIGEWAEVVVGKDLLKSVTNEEYAEFCDQVVKDSGYNWVTISCGDGTGIQFQGSISYIATYGKIDTDGCIDTAIGTIMLQGDGTYSYSAD